MIIKIKSEFLDTNNFKSFFMASWPHFLSYVKIPQVYEAGCLLAAELLTTLLLLVFLKREELKPVSQKSHADCTRGHGVMVKTVIPQNVNLTKKRRT